jgi:hypothetical protein
MFLFAGGLLAVGLLIAVTSMESTLAGDVRAARNERMPLGYADLHLPQVADQQNAAPVYEAIAAQRTRLVSSANLPSVGSNPSRERWLRNRAALVRLLAPEFEALQRLDRTTACAFPHDWTAKNRATDRFSALTGLVGDLCIKADLQDRSGDVDGTFLSLAVARRIAQDLRSEPLSWAQLEEFRCWRSIHTETARILLRHFRDGRTLDRLEVSLRSEPQPRDLTGLLGAEIVHGREMIRARKRFDRYMSIWFEDPAPSFLNPTLPNCPVVSDYLDLGFVSFWEKAWPHLCDEGRDWKQFRQELVQLYEKNEGPMANSNAWLIDTLWTTSANVPRLQADRRLLLTAISLFRTRLRTGAFPDATPQDVSDPDPVDGKPLRYRRTALGFDLFNADAGDPRGLHGYEAISFVGEQCDTDTAWQYASGTPGTSAVNVISFRNEIPEQPWPHFSFRFAPPMRPAK